MRAMRLRRKYALPRPERRSRVTDSRALQAQLRVAATRALAECCDNCRAALRDRLTFEEHRQ